MKKYLSRKETPWIYLLIPDNIDAVVRAYKLKFDIECRTYPRATFTKSHKRHLFYCFLQAELKITKPMPYNTSIFVKRAMIDVIKISVFGA